jgi:predicted ribosome quality control (RQC) complex YloA/Tae2 family protein
MRSRKKNENTFGNRKKRRKKMNIRLGIEKTSKKKRKKNEKKRKKNGKKTKKNEKNSRFFTFFGFLKN